MSPEAWAPWLPFIVPLLVWCLAVAGLLAEGGLGSWPRERLLPLLAPLRRAGQGRRPEAETPREWVVPTATPEVVTEPDAAC